MTRSYQEDRVITVTTLPQDRPLSPEVVLKTTLVMVLGTTCFPLIVIGSYYASPFYFSGSRALLAGLALLLPAFWLRRPLPKDRAQWGSLLMIGLLTPGIGFWGMFVAGVNIAPGIATVLVNTQPLFAAVLAFFVLSERLRASVLLGLFIGFLGIVLIGFGGFSGDQQATFGKGITFVLLGAIGVAAGNVLLKRLAGNIDVLMATGWQLVFGSVPLLLAAMYTESPKGIDWSWPYIASLLILSLLGTSAVFALWFDVLKHAQLSRLNAFTFLTPVLGLITGALFFGETFNVPALLGIALTLAGIGFVIRGAS